MEIYTIEDNKNKFDKPRINYFTTSQALTMFFTGFLGLNIFSYLVYSALVGLFPNSTALDMTTYTNFTTYAILVVGMLALSYFFNKEKFKNNIFDLKNKKTWLFIFYGLMIIYSASIAVSFIQSYLYDLAGISQTVNANQTSINSMLEAHPVLIIIMVSIFAPIVEEIAYRQGLFESVRPKSRVWAYIATILVFSFIHFGWTDSFYDTTNQVWTVNKETLISELIAIPSYISGGAVLAYVYDHENNVVPGMIVHGLYNLIGVVATLLIN